MSRLVIVLVILVATLAACTTAQPEPSGPTASPSAPGTASPSPVAPDPTDSPSPSTPAPVATPRPAVSPTPVVLTVEEQYLLDGILRGAIDCQPVREGLPRNATGGIECASDDPAVARVGFYLFDGEADLLAAYFQRMDAEGVTRDSGSCADGEGEGAYVPGENEVPSRQGCFVNDEGYANYRATVPGSLLYIGVLGRTSDTGALEDFAWRGNQDTPGGPTLWSEAAS
jgi:hypothetical protein